MRSVRAGLGLLLVVALVASSARPSSAQIPRMSEEDHLPDLLAAGVDKRLPEQARFVKPGDFIGDDVYEPASTEEPEQLVVAEQTPGKHIYIFKVQNDGAVPDTVRIAYEPGSGEPGYNSRLYLATEERNNRVKKDRPVDKPATSDEGYVFDLYPAGSEEGPSEQLFWLEVKIRRGFQEGRVEQFPFVAESLGGTDAAARIGSMVERLLDDENAAHDQLVLQVGEEQEEPEPDPDPDPGQDEIPVSQIRITDPTAANALAWPITRQLQVTAFAPGVQTWSPQSVAGWIGVEFFRPGNFIAGNMWFVRRVGGQWQAAPLEWIFQGMTRQFMTEQIIGGHALLSSGWGRWFPRPGEEIGFFLSTPGWGGARSPSGMQRTQIVRLNWGCRGNC